MCKRIRKENETLSWLYDTILWYYISMGKAQRTLKAVFARPTRPNIPFADLEALIVSLGGEVREGKGSAVVFELQGKRLFMHRPHQEKEAKRYQIERIRQFLQSAGMGP